MHENIKSQCRGGETKEMGEKRDLQLITAVSKQSECYGKILKS